MKMILQRLLLIVGILALVVLLAEIVISITATAHGSTPVRTVNVQAGPYPLTVSFYTYPANAGYAFPFAVVAHTNDPAKVAFVINSVPAKEVDATPVRASVVTDMQTHGIQGTAEITVKGDWSLNIVANGPQGQGMANVPIVATAPPPIPIWSGWLIAFIPLAIILAFLIIPRERKGKTRG